MSSSPPLLDAHPQVQAVLDVSPDGLLLVDAQGRITAANHAYLRTWQVQADQVVGADHVHFAGTVAHRLAQPLAFTQRLAEIYADREASSFDLLVFAGGRRIERRSRPQRIDGEYAGRVWSFHDITERHLAERALRDESRALDLLNNIGLRLAAELDLNPLLQAVTDAGRQISGADMAAYFPNEQPGPQRRGNYALSGSTHGAFTAMGPLRHTPLFARTLVEGRVVRSADVPQDPAYGQWPPHHGLPKGHPTVRSYLAVPVISRSGPVLGALLFGHATPGFFDERSERLLVGLAAQAAVAIDNARLYESERQARQLADAARIELEHRVSERTEALAVANRELESFAYSVSHDLRSPLSRVNGFARALLDMGEDRLEPRQRHYLARIRANVADMGAMIDAMLTLARLSWVPMHLRPVDLSEMAHDIAAELAEQEPERDCRIDIEPGLQAHGDPVLLAMLLGNLLRNGWKFTARTAGGRVTFGRAHEVPGPTPVFHVSDNGAGFDMDFADRLFYPFQRLHSPAEFPGTGVGLTTVRRIAERHGGRIWATGRPQQGARFFFTLQPGAEPPPAAVPAAAPGA